MVDGLLGRGGVRGRRIMRGVAGEVSASAPCSWLGPRSGRPQEGLDRPLIGRLAGQVTESSCGRDKDPRPVSGQEQGGNGRVGEV